MSQTPHADAAPAHVEIRVKGRLAARWSAWFAPLTVTAQDDGTTLLHGAVADQAALFGVLQQLRDLAVPLVSVVHTEAPVPPVTPETPAGPST